MEWVPPCTHSCEGVAKRRSAGAGKPTHRLESAKSTKSWPWQMTPLAWRLGASPAKPACNDAGGPPQGDPGTLGQPILSTNKVRMYNIYKVSLLWPNSMYSGHRWNSAVHREKVSFLAAFLTNLSHMDPGVRILNFSIHFFAPRTWWTATYNQYNSTPTNNSTINSTNNSNQLNSSAIITGLNSTHKQSTQLKSTQLQSNTYNST